MNASAIVSPRREEGKDQVLDSQNDKVEAPVSTGKTQSLNELTTEIISLLEKDKSLPPKHKDRLCQGTSISSQLMTACMARKISDIKYLLGRIENPVAEDLIRRLDELEEGTASTCGPSGGIPPMNNMKSHPGRIWAHIKPTITHRKIFIL